MKIYQLSGPYCDYAPTRIIVTCRTLVKLYALGVIWPISNLLVASCGNATDLRERLMEYLRETSV